MPRRSLDELDKKTWKQMKKEAGIKSAGWFKKADASVGKYVEAAQKARKRFEDGALAEDLIKYQDALNNLSNAFDEFVKSKGLEKMEDGELEHSERKVLLQDIKDWKEEIDEVLERDDLKKEHKTAILGDNARRFYGR